MYPITTTQVEIKSNDRLILFPWLHESNWSKEEKISCCLLHYTRFAQMFPKADLESISQKIFCLVEALFRAYQSNKSKLSTNQKVELIKIADTENEIILTMLGLAVVLTGKAGFEDQKVTLSVDTLQEMKLMPFNSMAINH